MPRFAIITPMYNAAATVAETIDSVLAQTLCDWEWYLMDDGSTDGTAEMAEAKLAGNPRAHVIRNGRVGHIGTLRNRALALTSAPYACFLDADDKWAPTFLEQQHALLTHAGAHVAHTRAMHIFDGQIIEPPIKYHGPAVCDPPEMLRYLCPCNSIYSPSTAIQTEVLKQEGGFTEHPDKFSVLDYDLWLRLAPKYRFAYNSEPLLYYRVSPDSLSGNPKNTVPTFRGEIDSLEAAWIKSSQLPVPYQRILRKMLSARQSQYARALLDQTPPAIDPSCKALRKAFRRGPIVSRYLPFQLLSFFGGMPLFWVHRLLRRVRG
jgi:glycosyltransferase involved in cell wall biosynthesis